MTKAAAKTAYALHVPTLCAKLADSPPTDEYLRNYRRPSARGEEAIDVSPRPTRTRLLRAQFSRRAFLVAGGSDTLNVTVDPATVLHTEVGDSFPKEGKVSA